MPEVAEIRLRYATSNLWFEQKGIQLEVGDHALVQTERGQEIGLVENVCLHPSEEEIAQLTSPLKPVLRKITPEDYDYIDSIDKLNQEAMPIFRELINKHELDMKPVAVDYLFGKDKAVFYFSSEDRVDFRALVRDLASRLHIGVDMRQIGVRDETRMVGGIAHCGEEYCCVRFNGQFQPVAIKMAKEQNLSLNPTKISGACGRLMCCLRYEFEAYKDFNSRAPKRGAKIDTPFGVARVTDFNTPSETIHLKLEEEDKTFIIPLSCMDCEKDPETGQCRRPTSVSAEALEQTAKGSGTILLSSLDRFENDLVDEVADNSHRTPRARGQRSAAQQTASPTPRRSRGQQPGMASDSVDVASVAEDESSVSTTLGTRRRRPGQHSSGVKTASSVQQGESEGAASGQVASQGKGKDKAREDGRRRRNRSGKKGGQNNGQGGQGNGQQEALRQERSERSERPERQDRAVKKQAKAEKDNRQPRRRKANAQNKQQNQQAQGSQQSQQNRNQQNGRAARDELSQAQEQRVSRGDGRKPRRRSSSQDGDGQSN